MDYCRQALADVDVDGSQRAVSAGVTGLIPERWTRRELSYAALVSIAGVPASKTVRSCSTSCLSFALNDSARALSPLDTTAPMDWRTSSEE